MLLVLDFTNIMFDEFKIKRSAPAPTAFNCLSRHGCGLKRCRRGYLHGECGRLLPLEFQPHSTLKTGASLATRLFGSKAASAGRVRQNIKSNWLCP